MASQNAAWVRCRSAVFVCALGPFDRLGTKKWQLKDRGWKRRRERKKKWETGGLYILLGGKSGEEHSFEGAVQVVLLFFAFAFGAWLSVVAGSVLFYHNLRLVTEAGDSRT